MSHIVIHDDNSNVTHYAEFDDVQAAASYLEDLVNQDADSNARLFALEPVEFAVKSYVKVEIGAAARTADTERLTNAEIVDEVVAEAPLSRAEVFSDEAVDDTVEYVEAAMAPVDVLTPMPEHTDDSPGGESRRGLFGR